MHKRIRQYLGIFAAILSYYLVHEGTHLITALYYGTFKQIKFMGLGMQIDVYAERMTDTQLALFCLAGPAASLLSGWLLLIFAVRICNTRSRMFKTVMWYTTLVFLLLDPVYLSILYDFFGGGDMNGIQLLFPETTVRVVFGLIGLLHILGIRMYLLPKYTESFRISNNNAKGTV